jgi:hypothetical protein
MLAACGSGAVSGAPIASPTAPVAATVIRVDPIPAPPCIVSIMSDWAHTPLPQEVLATLLVESSHLVVQGTIVAVLPARWTTPAGQRPIDPCRAHETGTANIVTPVVLHLDEPPIVTRVAPNAVPDLGGPEIVITTLGGQVGLDRITSDDPREHLALGAHVLVGLSAVDFDGPSQLLPTEFGFAWNVSFLFHITPDGLVIPAGGTPDDGESLAVVVARLVAAAAQLPPISQTPVVLPTPSEPVPTT